MDSEWFQALIRKKHVSVVQHRKQKAQWNSDTDGRFHPDLLHQIQHTRLKVHVQNHLHLAKPNAIDDIVVKQKIQFGDDMMDKVSKLLEVKFGNLTQLQNGLLTDMYVGLLSHMHAQGMLHNDNRVAYRNGDGGPIFNNMFRISIIIIINCYY